MPESSHRQKHTVEYCSVFSAAVFLHVHKPSGYEESGAEANEEPSNAENGKRRLFGEQPVVVCKVSGTRIHIRHVPLSILTRLRVTGRWQSR